MKSLLSIFFMTCFMFLFADFTLSNLGLGPKEIQGDPDGMKHEIYHHDLKPSLQKDALWGGETYPLCTNEFSFRISCDDVDKTVNKHYEIAFIGDSFTEGIGVTFEDTFVGKFIKNNEHISIVNVGVRSYSPIIYYHKVKYLLEEGFTFNNLIVAIDISDINDEATRYMISQDGQRIIDRETKGVSNSAHGKVNLFQFFVSSNFEYLWHVNNLIYDYFNPKKVYPYGIDTRKSLWPHEKDSADYGDMGVQGGIKSAVFYMEKLKKLLDEKNISLSVLVYPWPTQLARKEKNHDGVRLWQDFCERMGCKQFINANEIFFNELEHSDAMDIIRENYILGDVHFNEKGNDKVYKVLQEEVRR